MCLEESLVLSAVAICGTDVLNDELDLIEPKIGI